MLKTIKIKCPAKINLDLKVVNRRSDGFHNIESTMQTIGLYDFLTISVSENGQNNIILKGNSVQIPYDENNIVYKAVLAFLNIIGQTAKVEVYIEKNIPVSAGLAGGSADAAGVILGLNEIFEKKLTNEQLHEICATLGSDVNFCLEGGCKKALSRGEILENVQFREFKVSLIKPLNLGISAKDAYARFAAKEKTSDRSNFVNDLEWAIINDHEELKTIKKLYPQAVMTGSGSTYFIINGEFKPIDGYWVKNNILTVNSGCEKY